ncbi:hypothetical protein, partial [Filibacter tadaridae]|uniref:hypothetical protein n=1 Tax=Filibacter tadaridae TaxID=2483811 RepID=UPI0013582AF9
GDNTVSVNVTVTDPVEAPKAEVTLSVDQKTVSIEKGKTASVKVTETTTIEDKSTEADVTADATYAVEDAAIVSVEKG